MIWANKESRWTSAKLLLTVDSKGSHVHMREVHQQRICAFALQPEAAGGMRCMVGELHVLLTDISTVSVLSHAQAITQVGRFVAGVPSRY